MIKSREKLIAELEHMARIIKDYNDLLNVDCESWVILDALEQLKEQKTGHWVVLDNCSNEGIYCSECQTKVFDQVTKPKNKLLNYCPKCGAKMAPWLHQGDVPDKNRIISKWEGVLKHDPISAPWDLIDDTVTLLKGQGTRHGAWISLWRPDDIDSSICARCSECDRISDRPLGAYCKWCGAKMDLEVPD